MALVRPERPVSWMCRAAHRLPGLGASSLRRSLGEARTFQDVTVVPYEHLLEGPDGSGVHEGGPILPDWDAQHEARFLRDGEAVDVHPQEPDRVAFRVDRRAIWAGGVVPHFGHQIADFCTRIVQARRLRPDGVVVFAVPRPRSPDDPVEVPGFLWEILGWFGVGRHEVVIVTAPALVRDLLVAPQAEQLVAIGPPSGYLDLLDELEASRPVRRPRPGTVVVSRAGQPKRLAGERYVEAILERCGGVTVLRPEQRSLREQLDAYRSAERLVISEGSALHGLQLLGRSLGEVEVWRRRPGHPTARAFVEPRCRALRYVEIASGIVHGTTAAGDPAPHAGVCVPAESLLLPRLRSLSRDAPRLWRSDEFHQARDDDVRGWIRSAAAFLERTSTGARHVHDRVYETLDACGLTHLLPFARGVLES